jgi:opacity protein-like surface antigen
MNRFAALLFSLMVPSLVMASPSSPPFSGWNASLGVGVEMPNISMMSNLFSTLPSIQETEFIVSPTMTENQVKGVARIGYNRIFSDCFLVGLAVDAVFRNYRMKFHGRVTELNSELLYETDTGLSISNQYALLLKFGKLVCDKTLIYGLVGPQWGKFTYEFDATFSQNLGVIIESTLQGREKCYRGGVLLGLGTEFLLSRCISLALEYTHTSYGNCRIKDVEAPITVDGIEFPDGKFLHLASFKVRNNFVTLRLGFYY